MKAQLKPDISDCQINYGCGRDPRGLLDPDKKYTVTARETHRWHTRIFLEGVDGYFNSVLFNYS